MSQADLSRLVRAVRGQSPQHPAARRITAKATARDVHPTRGSEAIMQAVQGGGAGKQIASLNVRRADGSSAPAFCWGVPYFGWGIGEWAGGPGAAIAVPFDPSAMPGDDPVGMAVPAAPSAGRLFDPSSAPGDDPAT